MFWNPATIVEPSRKAGNSPTIPQPSVHRVPYARVQKQNIPSTTTVTAKACQKIGLPRETRNTRALRTCLAHPLIVASHQHPPPQRHGLGEICNGGQALWVNGRQTKYGAPDMKLEHHLREEGGCPESEVCLKPVRRGCIREKRDTERKRGTKPRTIRLR